jgi:hypothetical protein
VNFFDAEQEIPGLALEIFIGERLCEAGIWESPRTSDGFHLLREIERTPNHTRLCGQIWEIVHQTLHTFWLDVERRDDVRWTLYFDTVTSSPRRDRNLAYVLERPEDVEWRVTLTGAIAPGG